MKNTLLEAIFCYAFPKVLNHFQVPSTGVVGGQPVGGQLPIAAVGPLSPQQPQLPQLQQPTLPLAFPTVPGMVGSRHSSLLGASSPARRTQVRKTC